MAETLKVLIIEDSKEDSFLLIRALEKAGYEVTALVIETEKAMIKALAEKKWDLILSDYAMPSFDGIKALKLLRKKDKETPFIIVSGTISEEKAVSAMKSGANDYVIKDNLNRLIPAISRELREVKLKAERRQMYRVLRESKNRLYMAFNYSSIGMALISLDGFLLEVNDALAKMFSLSKSVLLKSHYQTLIPEDELEEFTLALKMLLNRQKISKQLEFVSMLTSEELVHTQWNVSLAKDEKGEPLYFVLQVQDVSVQKKTQESLNYLKTHDPLTGLIRRNLFDEALSHAISLARIRNNHIGIVLLTIERFKLFTDIHGHDMAEQLVKEFSERVKKHLDKLDIISRLNGIEFAIFFPDIKRDDMISICNKKLLQPLRKPFLIVGNQFHISTNIGVSFFPDDGDNSQELVKNASIALYYSSQDTIRNIVCYDKNMQKGLQQKASLEKSLPQALKEKQFVVYYQPILRLSDNRIIGAEGLIRWKQDKNTLVYPEEFILLAEEIGFIHKISEFVLLQVCRQLKIWFKAGLIETSSFKLSFNFSASQMHDKKLIDIIEKKLSSAGLSPQFLEIEITENTLMQNIDENIALLLALKAKGMQIAIDDFGTGYSSLSYLKDFKIDRLKIDKSFVLGLPNDKSHCNITLAIINLAHSLGLKVIAEGVENQKQYDYLKKHGCDEIQGYFISPALSADKFEASYLSTSHHLR